MKANAIARTNPGMTGTDFLDVTSTAEEEGNGRGQQWRLYVNELTFTNDYHLCVRGMDNCSSLNVCVIGKYWDSIVSCQSCTV